MTVYWNSFNKWRLSALILKLWIVIYRSGFCIIEWNQAWIVNSMKIKYISMFIIIVLVISNFLSEQNKIAEVETSKKDGRYSLLRG